MSMRLGENILPQLKNKGQFGDKTTLSTVEIESLVSTEKNRASSAEDKLSNELKTESETRLQKDIEISESLSSEVKLREDGDSALLQKLEDEEKSRVDSDNEISQKLDDEIKNREDADLVEEKARRSAINAVEYSISSEQKRALIQETSLEKAITTEKTEREEAIKKEVEDRNTAISNAISALDSADEEVDGQFISKVVGEDGVITITRKSFSDKVTEGDTNAPSGDAVYQAIQALGTLYELKGSVENFDSLPTEKKAGDVYNTTDTGDNYVWTGTEWDRLGGSTIVDALNFADPAANGVNLSFISSISQTNGKITAQKKTVQDASSRQKGVVFTTPNIEKTGTSVPTSSAVWSHVDDKISAEVKNRNTAISDAISQEVVDRDAAIEEMGKTKQDTLETQTEYSSKGTATKVPQISTNSLGQVTKIEEVTITQPSVGEGVLSIKKNGSVLSKTFSANASSDVEIDIGEVPIATGTVSDSEEAKDKVPTVSALKDYISSIFYVDSNGVGHIDI